MSETTQSSVLAEEKVVARVWKAINDKADPAVIREHLDTLPAAARLRVADDVAQGLRERASKAGDYAEMERVLPYIPGQGPRERQEIKLEARTVPDLAGDSTPPVAGDHVRLFRGTGNNLGAAASGQPVFFTTDPVKAARYGLVSYVDVPNTRESMARFATGHGGAGELVTEDRAVISGLRVYVPGGERSPAPPPPQIAPEPSVPHSQTAALSPDAQTIYQAVSRLLESNPVIAVEDLNALKSHAVQSLSARETTDGRIELTPDIRMVAGKPPVHTLDEMREMFVAVRDRAAVPADRMAPETAAEVRESLQQQITGSRSMVDLMKLYGQDDTQRAIKSLDAHPEQSRVLADAMEATGKRLLAEDRVRLGLDEPAERRRARGVQDAPGDGSGAAPDTPAITISRRGDNGAPSTPERAPERAVDSLARDYDVRERGDERHYHRRDTGALAIRATETHIHGVQRDAATIGAMLDLAAARGWNDVQVRGDRDAARQTWIEATARGMAVEGYQPTRDDRHAVDQRRVERREQGLDAPAVPPAPGERSRATDAPERRQTRGEAVGGDGESAPGMAARGAAAARAGRQERDAWITGTRGFDGLSGRQQQHAEQAYDKWAAMNPDRTFDLRGYVSHVQEKQAERREAREERTRDRPRERDRDDERTPHMPASRKIELPGRGMGF